MRENLQLLVGVFLHQKLYLAEEYMYHLQQQIRQEQLKCLRFLLLQQLTPSKNQVHLVLD